MRTRQFKLGPMGNLSYLLWDESTASAAIIDPAWEPEKLAEYISAKSLRLECLLLTHAHPDHVNGVPFFTAANPLLPVYLHEADYFMLKERPGALKPVQDGGQIEAGALKIRVMHTPGHTPGSVCYRAGGAVFTGDTLFVGECGRVDLPGSDPEALYESFVKLAAIPDGAAVYPGHSYNGDASTFGAQKRENRYLKLAREGLREDFLAAVL